LIDGLGENAAGYYEYSNGKECTADASAAAYAPFHGRSLKVLFIKIIPERDATCSLHKCTNEKQATPTAFLPALAALSTVAAAMNSRTLMLSARYWPSDALHAGIPAVYFLFVFRS